MSVLRVVLLVALTALAVPLLASAIPLGESAERRVERLAGELRCPVCQGLSVRDSPSETSRAMREVIVERVAAGRTDEEIRDEFRRAYGDWILLSPPLLDWRVLAWLVPPVLLFAGLGLALRFVRAPPSEAPSAREPTTEQLAALRARVAREEAHDL